MHIESLRNASNTSKHPDRRKFLQQVGISLFSGAMLLPESRIIAGDLAQVVKIKAGELAKTLGYTGATKEELSRTSERDIRMNILNELTYKDWLLRTRTAKVEIGKGSFGYVDDLLELAAYQIREKKNPKEISYILSDIEKFGKGIKSARLATMIAAATVANYSVEIPDAKGNPITSLEGLLKTMDEQLNSEYRDMSPKAKITVENILLEDIYGKKAADNLHEMFPVSKDCKSNPNALKDFIQTIDKLKTEKSRTVEV